jgi:hypothetical protein
MNTSQSRFGSDSTVGRPCEPPSKHFGLADGDPNKTHQIGGRNRIDQTIFRSKVQDSMRKLFQQGNTPSQPDQDGSNCFIASAHISRQFDSGPFQNDCISNSRTSFFLGSENTHSILGAGFALSEAIKMHSIPTSDRK